MTQSNILITGASGNVGSSLVKQLELIGQNFLIADRRKDLANNSKYRYLDFESQSTFESALNGIELLFLVRPPALSDVKKYFRPFLYEAKKQGVKHIVFLSLQGADKIKVVPHRSIELEIINLGFNYTFLRPSFFMQNLSTTHKEEIKNKNEIFVPAGRGKTSLIDVEDIAAVAATILVNPEKHQNKSYELTGSESLNYFQVAEILSEKLNRQIVYRYPNVISFLVRQLKVGRDWKMSVVMTGIYLTARFGQASHITNTVTELLQRNPTTFQEFADREIQNWM
ncbi:MAG: SDR family oxidoreductase [Patescibacteria group bacterium]